MSSRVSKGRRNAVIGLSIASLVGVGALSGVVATSASAVVDNPFTSLITLQTGSTNQVTLYPANAQTATTPQPLSVSACRMTSDNSVITFTGGPGRLGLRQGSVGIINGGTGESCGQLNAPGEFLTLDLGSKVASTAALDIELQQNAVVLATITGLTSTYYVELQSGNSITNQPTPVGQGGAPSDASVSMATCQLEPSSAANSFTSDNCRWIIDQGPFSKISLKAIKGNASLEGGVDGTVTRISKTDGVADEEPVAAAKAFTYFSLLEACDANNTSTTIASTGGAGLPTGNVKRSVQNVDGSLCLADGLTATARDANTVDIIKRGQPYAQYVVKIDWKKPPTRSTATSLAVSETTIQFDVGDSLSPEVTLPWCPTSLFDDATSVPNTDPNTGGRLLKPVADLDTASPDGIVDELDGLNITRMDGQSSGPVQFACIQDRDVEYKPAVPNTDPTKALPARYVVTDVIYVIGDLRMRG